MIYWHKYGPIYISIRRPVVSHYSDVMYWFNAKSLRMYWICKDTAIWKKVSIHIKRVTGPEPPYYYMLTDTIVKYNEMLDIAVIMGYL